jgi:hypothetical protein
MTFSAKNVSFDAYFQRGLSYDYRMDASPEPISVSVTVLSQMFLYLDSLKVDIDGFLHSLGVDPETVRTPDTRLPIGTYLLIQDQAAEYVNDPYFGLHMGEFAEAGSWSILGYMMMNANARRRSRNRGDMQPNRQPDRSPGRSNSSKSKPSFSRRLTLKMRHCFEDLLQCADDAILTGDISPLEVTFVYPNPLRRPSMNDLLASSQVYQKNNSITMTSVLQHTDPDGEPWFIGIS